MQEKKNNALEKVEKIISANTTGKRPYPEVYGVYGTNVIDSTQLEPVGVIMDQKEDKEKENSSNQKEKVPKRDRGYREKNRGIRGWLTAVISLSAACVVLATALVVNSFVPRTNDAMLESSYNRAFLGAVKQVDNIDLNLSKILATKDTGAMQKYLVDTAINSELAESDLGELPLKDESKFYTTKLVNQIGDYSKYLNDKIIDGESLTDSDYQMLNSLYRSNLTLKNTLHQMQDDMGSNFSMTDLLDQNTDNLMVKGFNDLENLSVDYPELIYDGPFSDGQENRKMKGLSGEEIDNFTAIENFKKIFAEYSLTDIESNNMANGDVECFNVTARKGEELVFAQFTKTGGKLILYSESGSCNRVDIDEATAIEKGQEFLEKLGIKEMKAVWINLANNLYTINFAGEKEGVIIYPDLIKIRVCAQTGNVIGLEAKSYYTNHQNRSIESPTLSKNEAKTHVFDGLNIDDVRLAIVPVGSQNERLCYEFYGEYENSQYYVYIDAKSGKQVEMFKVIESTEGEMLM